MSVSPEDLTTLRRAALAPALPALALALAGTVLALLRLRWPGIPAALVVAPVATGLGLVGLGLIRRARHLLAMHRRR